MTTRDPVELTAALGQVFDQSVVKPPAGGAQVSVCFREYAMSGMWLARLSISRATMWLPENPCYTVCISTVGDARSSVGGQTVVTRGNQCIVASAGSAAEVEYLSDRCNVIQIRFDRAALQNELSHILGRSVSTPLTFDLSPDLNVLGPFQSTLRLLEEEVGNPRILARKPIAEQLYRLLASSLIHSAPHNYSAEIASPTGFTGPRAIRTAIELLEADPLGFTTVGDIAKAVSLSVRALEEGFNRHVGTTPMQYRRRVRLERARRQLLDADAEDITATSVASRWGYGNYGRFAAEYRREFGSTPFEDLQR
ncbi:helix-turn-helix domain-containing protein [Nocardia sp. R6R-6]|uniref:helix-turn-helix domain-containing protein n=1 Tax=Nocardia sp. R6R-6 TaxID=3459303 RepID=UPI00403E2C25